MSGIIEYPDFEEFLGNFFDTSVTVSQYEFDYAEILAYIKNQNKPFSEISKTEIEKFRL